MDIDGSEAEVLPQTVETGLSAVDHYLSKPLAISCLERNCARRRGLLRDSSSEI